MIQQQSLDWLAAGEAATSAGYRLARLEIYNWGTFNGEIWAIDLAGGTALLTGDNGSGKSTIVDALVTLLVPPNKRVFNRASGMEGRRERDERSYLLGAYGHQRDPDSPPMTQYLRDRHAYAVLLAIFRNELLVHDVTLAQVLWLEDNGLRRIHVVAQQPLSIETHFHARTGMSDLRRRLKQQGAEVYEEFSRYFRQFCQLLDVRSEKAFDPFAQTVGIKEIGSLNAFIRQHMLEQFDVTERLSQLRANFKNLTQAHAAMEMATRQLEILTPLIEEAAKYDELEARIAEADILVRLVPACIAERMIIILGAAITTKEEEIAALTERDRQIQADLARTIQQIIDLTAAEKHDEVGQLLLRIEEEIRMLQSAKKRKQSKANDYTQLAESLGLPGYSHAEQFVETKRQAEALLAVLKDEGAQLTITRDAQVHDRDRIADVCRTLEEDLESLRGRANQIPTQDLILRQQLLESLDLEAVQLPFVGELIRVREKEVAWEPAIERLLHSFGRQILVSEELYAMVSQYVNTTDLKGRLVYHRMDLQRSFSHTSQQTNKLISKLEIKPDTPFIGWLEAELSESWDYTCCPDIDTFRQSRRAITLQGQIKHGSGRHEKDDRYMLGDRKRYVLGWDNRAKITALANELAAQTKAYTESQAAVDATDQAIAHREQTVRALRRLLDVFTFDDIDWQSDATLIQSHSAQMQKLEASADQLHELRRQLDSAKTSHATLEQQQRATIDTLASARESLGSYQRELADTRSRAVIPELTEHPHLAAKLRHDIPSNARSLQDLRSVQDQMILGHANRSRALQGQQKQLTPTILGHMNDFRQLSPDYGLELDASLESLPGYRRVHQQILRDDLPRHRDRFKALLDKQVVNDINLFRAKLENFVDDVRRSIERLNVALADIDYTLVTFIRLLAEQTRLPDVREFRQMLTACIPNVGIESTSEDNEMSFRRIQALLARLEADEIWARKVLDVRNWLDFSAEEVMRADGRQKDFVVDSSGKSGGQKTKLAYTILASAIAYQYGINQDASDMQSFRFVVVDEAFSKSDDGNARYAMELFRKLGLQLLVVTPRDKVWVVEPYIATCHWVFNNDTGSDSRVHTLAIGELRRHLAAVTVAEGEQDDHAR